MSEYQPTTALIVNGDAKKAHGRAESVIGKQLTGAVASVDGEVSHIVVDGDLSQSELDALETEFSVSWVEK